MITKMKVMKSVKPLNINIHIKSILVLMFIGLSIFIFVCGEKIEEIAIDAG